MKWHHSEINRASTLLGAAIAVVLGCNSDGMQDPTTTSTGTPDPTTSGASGGASSGVATVSSGEVADSTGVVGSTGVAGCGEIQGEGYAVGQISDNWTLLDVNGAEVQLHDYCGKVIYLESGAEW